MDLQYTNNGRQLKFKFLILALKAHDNLVLKYTRQHLATLKSVYSFISQPRFWKYTISLIKFSC